LLPLRLAFVSMVLTIALIATTGVLLLGLSLGAAVLLGAILAPANACHWSHGGSSDRSTPNNQRQWAAYR
jgi:hypothetical protein